MRIAYIEPFSGASGNMLLGALFDAGLRHDVLIRELAALGLPEIGISITPVAQHGISGTHAEVEPESGHHARSWRDIRSIITNSSLPDPDKSCALDVFENLAKAEATVHQVAVDDVHFHEVGALDTIIDIVGTVVGMRLLGVEKVYSAPVHIGGGTVNATHGLLPVPAPATARLMADHKVPIAKPMDGELTAGELLTPTGAAILATIATFDRPPFTPDAVGVGFGTKQLPWANMIRVTIGEQTALEITRNLEHLLLLETNIDDMNPQFYEVLIERLFETGALDVWSTPIQMKKGRPAQCLSVLAKATSRDDLVSILIEHSTTLGVRVLPIERIAADRRIETVATKWGDVRIKLKIWRGRVLDIAPEYEDCATIARAHGINLRAVWNEAYRIGEVYIGRRSENGANHTLIDPGLNPDNTRTTPVSQWETGRG